MFSKEKNKISIIAELHPQHGGDCNDLFTMILQCKQGGANAVKLQLYDTLQTHGNEDRKYLEYSDNELAELFDYCYNVVKIPLYCSVFSKEQLSRYISLIRQRGYNTSCVKIAFRKSSDFDLIYSCLTQIHLNTFVSFKDYESYMSCISYKHMSYKEEVRDRFIPMLTIPQYPALLKESGRQIKEQLDMFKSKLRIFGYSDHCPGLIACKYAIMNGASFIEKHFTLCKSRQQETEKGHFGSMDYNDLVELKKFCLEYQTFSDEF